MSWDADDAAREDYERRRGQEPVDGVDFFLDVPEPKDEDLPDDVLDDDYDMNDMPSDDYYSRFGPDE